LAWFADMTVLMAYLGFAVVGEYEDQKIQDAQKEAFQQMLGFLNEH